jgi:hypothetical protein
MAVVVVVLLSRGVVAIIIMLTVPYIAQCSSVHCVRRIGVPDFQEGSVGLGGSGWVWMGPSDSALPVAGSSSV